MTAVALSTLPQIVCPAWCVVPAEDHIADLQAWEGYVIHWSGDSTGVRHSEFAHADGPQNPSEPPLIFVDDDVTGITLDQAQTLAEAILAAVKEARA